MMLNNAEQSTHVRTTGGQRQHLKNEDVHGDTKRTRAPQINSSPNPIVEVEPKDQRDFKDSEKDGGSITIEHKVNSTKDKFAVQATTDTEKKSAVEQGITPENKDLQNEEQVLKAEDGEVQGTALPQDTRKAAHITEADWESIDTAPRSIEGPMLIYNKQTQEFSFISSEIKNSDIPDDACEVDECIREEL